MVRDEYAAHTSRADWHDKVKSSLQAVRLEPSAVLGKYPHQLSGGQLQRLLVARALLLDIDLLVADEITSMLDASTRIDVLNLLAELRERGLGVLFITHDLSLGNYISSRTIILRRGSIVEMGETRRVYDNPQHPYTRLLLESVPRLHEKWRTDGAPTNGDAVESAPRTAEAPKLVEVEEGHLVAEVG
jgi:peptide/nickel transport system ATP-binding protein